MYLHLFLGNPDTIPGWERLAAHHARRLGMTARFHRSRTDSGRLVSVCRFIRGEKDSADLDPSPDPILLSTGETPPRLPGLPRPQGNRTEGLDPWSSVPRIRLDSSTGRVDVMVPPASTEQICHTRDQRGLLIGNDLRLVGAWAGSHLDPRGVYSLFQYAAVPAPMTVFENVHRIPNGHWAAIQPGTEPVETVGFFRPGLDPDRRGESFRTAEVEREYWEQLDQSLSLVPRNAALYFSGGVDSALLAGLLARQGRDDIQLVNFSFGPDDTEAAHASRVARAMPFTLHRVEYMTDRDLAGVLSRIALDYSFPFADTSVIPVNALVEQSMEWVGASGAALEGLGPDQTFGVAGANRMLQLGLAVPQPLRALIGSSYRLGSMWSRPSRMAHLAGRFRKSAQMPRDLAFGAAQNCLDGIAYHLPRGTRAEMEAQLHKWIVSLGDRLPGPSRYSLLETLHRSTSIGAKSHDALWRRGARRLAPFLEPRLLDLSFRMQCAADYDRSRSKAFLKARLAELIPPELVYRPKSGFAPPFRRMLSHTAMKRAMEEVVLAASNPLRPFIRIRPVHDMLRRAGNGEWIDHNAEHFVWTLIFLSSWLRQLEPMVGLGGFESMEAEVQAGWDEGRPTSEAEPGPQDSDAPAPSPAGRPDGAGAVPPSSPPPTGS